MVYDFIMNQAQKTEIDKKYLKEFGLGPSVFIKLSEHLGPVRHKYKVHLCFNKKRNCFNEFYIRKWKTIMNHDKRPCISKNLTI